MRDDWRYYVPMFFNKINKLVQAVKQLGKGQQELIQSRRKWKRRYYKMKIKNKDLQESVDQIYEDYQDIGKIAFDYSEKIQELEKSLKETRNNLERDGFIGYADEIQNILEILK